MLRRISLLEVFIILTPLTGGLAEASSMQPAAQSTSSWDEVANTLICCALHPLAIGPAAKILPIVAIVVGGLMFAFTEDPSKRLLAGIVFAAGMLIGAANFLVWLFVL